MIFRIASKSLMVATTSEGNGMDHLARNLNDLRTLGLDLFLHGLHLRFL